MCKRTTSYIDMAPFQKLRLLFYYTLDFPEMLNLNTDKCALMKYLVL
ncbi:hypothetical protein BLGI_2650 [Brevibacillus laterosporus GI-9]|nr:hypothetical protein BLGI_2650 [Brevibacillus laterosporus GI-9]